MKIVNYGNAEKILEFGIKLKSDAEVFDFFKKSRLSFEYLKYVSSGIDRRHIIQRVPETISVTDKYEYYPESKLWSYQLVQGQMLPVACRIYRFCYNLEYRLIVDFHPVINKRNEDVAYSLLRPVQEGTICDYSGYVVTFRHPESKNAETRQHIHKTYVLSLIAQAVGDGIDHYAVKDD